MASSAAAVSAPGKVLFAGGFLVLDRQHTGLVFGLNARIHVHVQSWSDVPEIKTSVPIKIGRFILVQSPQFRDAQWLYTIDPVKPAEGQAIHITQITDTNEYTQSGNKFVHVALTYTLTYLAQLSKNIDQSIKVTVLADNDYYSQSSSNTQPTVKDGFSDFGVKLTDAHKTGLGSSAALTTALVSALITFYADGQNVPQEVIHNLAQAAHCAAQGKVGSGFDVAVAVYGSSLYRRFSPSVLEVVGDAGSPGFAEKLQRCIEDSNPEHKWDTEVSDQAVRIPDDLMLVMCDVDCGTETPSMVRKLLQWRKDNSAEAGLLWSALQQGTDDICANLRRMAQDSGSASTLQQELGDIIKTTRSLVREMSAKSGVPVEPDVITELLDFCTSVPGVIGGVAPGAGGYDAVAILLQNRPEVLDDLQQKLEGWTSKNEASDTRIGRVRLLGVKQDNQGSKNEELNRYRAWV